jgi:26S proteasome regulatory subunit N2
VASKVYYHLGSFEDSLNFALGAGELFDVMSRSEYVDTTIGKLDFYCNRICLHIHHCQVLLKL